MATLIVSFGSEEEAKEAVGQLMQADMGEVRARVLDSSEWLSYPKTESTSPEITPDLGSHEVRPSVPPKVPEAEHEDAEIEMSGVIPTTGGDVEGVQVMIEVDDRYEARAREILGMRGAQSGEQVGE